MIHFITDSLLPNYLCNEKPYHNLHKFEGDCEPAYYYWILWNAGWQDIALSLNDSDAKTGDVVVACYNHRLKLEHRSNYKLCNIVSDDLAIEGSDIYIAYDKNYELGLRDINSVKRSGIDCDLRTRQWHHIMLPLPVGMKRSKPNYPPTIYSYIGRQHTLDECIDDRFIRELSEKEIHLQLDYDTNCNRGNENVFFGLRPADKPWGRQVDDTGKVHYTRVGQKTANRLYCAWHMGIPSIFEDNSAMAAIRETEHDYLIANTADELRECMVRLKRDKTLYNNMAETAQRRSEENSYSTICNQWQSLLKKIK